MDAELTSWCDAGQYFDYLGFDVFYRMEGSGPPLLLIHGYPFNSFDWAPIWPTLTQRFTVIAPDMMGMGFSAKPVAYQYSVHDHADMHEALLDHLGVGNAHILAHDIGDSVGQELLARHEFGQHAYGALGIDSITWLNGGMFVETYTPRAAQKLMSGTPLGDLLSPLQNSSLSRRVLEPTVREMFGPNTKPTRLMMDVFNQILDYNDGRRVLHKVGRFIKDRHAHRNRWVRAMRQTAVPMRLIDGPIDPNSGAHMA
ncbi:MAG: alpha/beta fold hydrolase, partial [Mycobacterium sp.]